MRIGLGEIFTKLPRELQGLIYFFRFRKLFKRKTSIGFEDGLIRLKQQYDGYSVSILFFHPQRISRYFIGIQERLQKLMREYCIDQVQDLENGVIIDIGSNIGEFTLAMEREFPSKFNYIRFEPALEECKASQWNLRGVHQELVPMPLWHERATLPFFASNQTGDSSLFRANPEATEIEVTATTLDEELVGRGIDRVELIKLEAEGAEPEVLAGAISTLQRTRYVVADLGPERGIEQLSTFEMCRDFLTQRGFRLVGRNPGERMCFVFHNELLENKKL